MKISPEQRKNLFTYLWLMGLAAIGMFYGRVLLETHPGLRVWELATLLLVALGLPFVFLQSRAALPNFWQPEIPMRERFVLPLILGLAFGILDVIVFKVILHPEPYDELPPFLQPFPYSVFLYLSGAFEVEVFYRLIPLTLIMLLGASLKGGRYLDSFFWAGAVLTSLREPLEQVGENAAWVTIYALLAGFLMNLLQAFYFRKAGFLASLSLRLCHYLIWHILLGAYVEFVELG